MIVFLLLATLLSQRAGALPLTAGPTTTPTIVHKVVFGVFSRASCYDVRSTYEIVRSCLVTIAACVYRAIHPNIPDPNLSFVGKLKVMVKTMVYALIAPEVMILWAIRQRIGANIVVNEVNKIKPELNWTQTHGQFAQMGGFGRKDDKRILHPPTLIELLRNDRLDVEELQLTRKEINDKSKGDLLSKAVVAFQTTWFVFECLVRLQQGLPIIELEVVTLAFATLNVMTYALWWYKPLNVMCPIYLHIRPIPTPQPANSEESPLLDEEYGVEAVEGKVGVVVAVDLGDEGWLGTAWQWLIVKPFWVVARPLRELVGDEEVDSEATHVSTFYAMQIPEDKFSWVTILSSFIGMIFGGIHFLSWKSTFPTHLQLVLWRASSIVMVAQPSLFLLWNLCGIVYHRAPGGSGREAVAKFVLIIFAAPSIGGTIPYTLARFCVLVLAFLTLRDLPLPAFANVSWTAYIPHL